MGRLVRRCVFAGVTVAWLGQVSAFADEKSAVEIADEPKISAETETKVEEKPVEILKAAPTPNKPRALFQHASYPDAWRAAQQSNRPILVYVCMPNCHYCVKMKQQVYQRPNVKDLVASSFETLKADRYAHPKLISSLKVRLYPTTVLVSPNNKILDVIEGYSEPAKFQQRLQTGLAAANTSAVKKIAAR